MADIKSNIQEQWENPIVRKIVMAGCLIAVSIPLFSPFINNDAKNPLETMKKEAEVIEPLFNNDVLEEMSQDEVMETWSDAKRDIVQGSKAEQEREREQQERMSSLESELDDITEQNKRLHLQLEAIIAGQNNNTPISAPKNPSINGVASDNLAQFERRTEASQYTTYTKPPTFSGNVVRTITQSKMREVKSVGDITETVLETQSITESKAGNRTKDRGKPEKTPEQIQAEKEREMEVFLPATSIISGTLITGVDAPTGLSSTSTPVPVMMRVKKEALLPNHFQVDIKECRIIGSATGRLSSHRVVIRSELIACIREDGQAIEVNLPGYAVSSYDGKEGVKGTLVQKNGDMIAASVKAGALEGFTNIAAPQRVNTVNTDPNADPFQTINFGSALKSASLNGAGSAMQRVAEYYIALAEETFPVIELNPGIEIDFVLTKGTSLKIR